MRQLTPLICILLLTMEARGQIFGVGGNMAALPALTLDAGLDLSVGKGHTVSAELLMRPIYPERIFYCRATCRKYRTRSNVGPFIGVSAGYMNFAGSERYGEGIGIGASIGYRFVVSKRIDLSLEAGGTLAAIRDNRLIRTPGAYDPDLWETRNIVYCIPFPLAFKIHYLF